MHHDHPDFRATIHRGRITLVAWHPNLMRPAGPAGLLFRRRDGLVVADLTILREDDGDDGAHELIVKVLAGDLDDTGRRALLDWAASLGYTRVWLPDEIVEPADRIEAVGSVARVRCPSCRSRWEDDDSSFWLTVREWGHFPLGCPLCGADLPQWTVAGP